MESARIKAGDYVHLIGGDSSAWRVTAVKTYPDHGTFVEAEIIEDGEVVGGCNLPSEAFEKWPSA